MIFCCNWPEKRSDDRLLDALISWTKNKLGSDESVVREVCRSLWQRASAMTTRTFKELRGWAEDTDPLAKEAVIKSTLAIMAKEISLGDIINAPAPKGIVTRVCPPPSPYMPPHPSIDATWHYVFFVQAKLVDLLAVALCDNAEFDTQTKSWLSFAGSGWEISKVV